MPDRKLGCISILMVVTAGLIFLMVASSSGIVAARLVGTPTAYAYLPFVQVQPSPTPIIETWLDQVNGYREQAGVPSAYEDFTLSYNCHQHAQYMAENDLLTHDQIPGLPFASLEGQLCAQNGLVWLSDFSSPHWLPVDSIDEWMGSVGHRLWMLYPTTTTFGYGFYTTANNRTGAALDVLSAANFGADGGYLGWPVRYPAPGQVGVPATAYPVTLNWRYHGDIPIITSTSLTTASGTPIYHIASNGLDAGHKGIKILPNTALPDNVVFVVSVTGTYGGFPFSYNWKFSTGDTPIP